ncbi:MAG: sulfatase [Lachnospirales bacterium]
MKKPNILLIMADQLRFNALGCYGNKEINTPNIDKIAIDGSIFDNHFIQNPVCSPSRCSILTGRYPKNHGTRDNGIPLKASEITLAEVLSENGYSTAAIGKMHLTSLLVEKNDEQDDWPKGNYGFSTLHTTCDNKTGEYLNWLKNISYEDYLQVKEQGERKIKEDQASASKKDKIGLPQMHKNNINPKYHQSTWIADKTIEFIEQSGKEKPFFALCSFVDPHHPFDPPAPYDALYEPEQLSAPISRKNELEDKPPHFLKHLTGNGYSNEKYDYRNLYANDWKKIKSAYYGMITLIDDNIGRILSSLSENNLENDTLILFTSDHGELLGDHGLLFKGPFHYDSLIKAPLIMKLPSIIPQGSRYSCITEHVDIMSTILDIAGIRPPNGAQGISMLSALNGGSNAAREYAMTEFNCYDWGLNIKTLTGKNYKLTYYAGENFGELYNRNKDPNEFKNLWDIEEYKEIKGVLLKKLMDKIIETEDSIPIRIGKY